MGYRPEIQTVHIQQASHLPDGAHTRHFAQRRWELYGSADSSWNYLSDEANNTDPSDRIIGSYGFNLDLLSDKPGYPMDVPSTAHTSPNPTAYYVVSDAVGKLSVGDYPDMGIMADCIWRDFEGRNNDNPLDSSYYTNVTKTLHDGPVSSGGSLASGQSGIERCNIDRHDKAVNVGFRDGSYAACEIDRPLGNAAGT